MLPLYRCNAVKATTAGIIFAAQHFSLFQPPRRVD
jgi:hypothetical protein